MSNNYRAVHKTEFIMGLQKSAVHLLSYYEETSFHHKEEITRMLEVISNVRISPDGKYVLVDYSPYKEVDEE